MLTRAIQRRNPPAALSEKPQKQKKCAICKELFPVFRSMQKVCGPKCAEKIAEVKRLKEAAKREQEERAKTRVQKEALKTRSDYIKEAQHAFNAFIRERDKNQLCICCGLPWDSGYSGSTATGGAFDCGHYRSVGSAPHLRFDERNAHGQKKQCNRYGAGRAVDYRIGLIARIGRDAVEALEADNTVRKYTIDELKLIKAEYKAKLKMLLADKEVA